jgi:hypothetical protein
MSNASKAMNTEHSCRKSQEKKRNFYTRYYPDAHKKVTVLDTRFDEVNDYEMKNLVSSSFRTEDL